MPDHPPTPAAGPPGTERPDPLVRRDSAGNIAPIAQFSGEFTAWQAAQHFGEMATPEPRRAWSPEGDWMGMNYWGTFKFVGGERIYRITYDGKCKSWRVYMMPNDKQGKLKLSEASHARR